MAEPTRNQRIVRECEESGEPYFVIRAKDALSINAVGGYAELAVEWECDGDFVAGVDELGISFAKWQREHPDQVKTPDLRPGE